jgi:hypothetical protein
MANSLKPTANSAVPRLPYPVPRAPCFFPCGSSPIDNKKPRTRIDRHGNYRRSFKASLFF